MTSDKNHTNREGQLPCDSNSNVVNLFSRQVIDETNAASIVRIVSESRGTRMLYASYDQPERLIAVPILCWALREDGHIVGMVPWLDEILACEDIENKYSVSWEGYYNSQDDEIFLEPPADIASQLTVAARYPLNARLAATHNNPESTPLKHEALNLNIVQEISDPVGTHALLFVEESDSLILTSVISWALDNKGCLHGMLADDGAIEKLPVLPGDPCLFSAFAADNFRCFFQRDIAEQIRTQNPETLEAIEQLFGNQ